MPSELRFGVGCFHFGIKKKPPFKFDTAEYTKELEAFLQSISNISNIYISTDPISGASFDIQSEPPSVEAYTFPLIAFLQIEFELYIPFRIQEQIARTKKYPFEKLSTERFFVSIFHAYHCPVTYIEPAGATGSDDPSDAVIIVREFIKEQSKISRSDYIDFQVLGPSPFHADFYIKEPGNKEDAIWLFWHEDYDMPGYDTIEFFFDPDAFDSIEEARDFIFSEIKQEFDLFYYITQIENRRSLEWDELKEKVDSIIRIQRMKGITGPFRRYFSSSQLNEVFISIAEFESDDIFLNSSIQDSYSEIYESDNASISLRKYLDNAIKRRKQYPTKQLVELATLFEGRREKVVESMIVIISAVLGGIVGSLLTILAS
jgi:hypothetical protein